MQKVERNNLVEAIQSVGLNPLDFELQENDLFDVHIKHKYTASWFDARFEDGLLKGKYVVGDSIEWLTSPSTGWSAMRPRVKTWLEEVKRDVETPDKLAELQKKAQLLSASSDSITENTPFTSDEQEHIVEQLQIMVEVAQRRYSLSPAQVKAWNDKLEYVVEASHRLGRKDWFLLFAGAIFTYLPIFLPPEAILDMSLGLLKAIGHLNGFSDLSFLP
jgi:hypothetical protein